MTVNLSPVGGVAAQFFDNDGNVLSGGKIYTYVAGTSTPTPTYTTAAGNIAHSNPIVLDSGGRVPTGEIWLTDGVLYKFVLKDSGDALIATYDNISGINSNAVAYTNQQEIITATAGQTVFNLTITYGPGTNSLSVFVDGVNQYGPGAQYAYTETDQNTVTFNSGLHVGAEVKFTSTQQQGAGAVDASQVSYDPPFTGSVPTNVEAKLAQTVSVLDFGADPTGTTDSRAAIQAAVDALQAADGGVVYFPAGEYLLTSAAGLDGISNGVLVPYISANGTSKRIILQGAGQSTVLKANSNDMCIIRFCDSHGGVRDMALDGNGHTNVIGLGCIPESTTQTSSLVFQLYNIFSGLYILNCAEAATFKCGPDVGGGDSGCYYNVLRDSSIYYCTRGIWLQEGPNAGCSGVNRNNFYNVRIGQNTNTGVQIDSGDTNKFYGVNFEGISSGTTPNTTPTAIYIVQTGALSGLDNNSNRFFGATFEGCTRHLNNYNGTSQFFGCEFDGAKVNTSGGAGYGNLCVGGLDPSSTPQIYGGGIFQTNSQIPGYNNGLTFATINGLSGVDADGAMFNATSFQETSGKSVSIANGATFNITIPTVRRPQLLFLYSGFNLNQNSVYMVSGDGSGSAVTTSIVTGSATAAGSAASTVTVTNGYGGSAVIYWTLVPFGVAIP